MSDTIMIALLLGLVALAALGLGFVALVLRGGSWNLKLGGIGVRVESRVETREERKFRKST